MNGNIVTTLRPGAACARSPPARLTKDATHVRLLRAIPAARRDRKLCAGLPSCARVSRPRTRPRPKVSNHPATSRLLAPRSPLPALCDGHREKGPAVTSSEKQDTFCMSLVTSSEKQATFVGNATAETRDPKPDTRHHTNVPNWHVGAQNPGAGFCAPTAFPSKNCHARLLARCPLPAARCPLPPAPCSLLPALRSPLLALRSSLLAPRSPLPAPRSPLPARAAVAKSELYIGIQSC